MSNQSAHAGFDALGEPVRRRILELLREGPTPVGRLAERLPVGRPAVSKHLRVLSNAGLIEHHSAGTRNLYALAPHGMAAAQQWLVSTWDTALAAYPAEGGDTFVVLLHRPGPAAPTSGSLFEDPRFGQHVAFLNRMREAGYLVRAGPLGDAAGEGMTILRLPGAGRFAEAARLATEDDASVAGGFFTVTVRPWQVMMGAG
jgi:uncharacterized protein YciI